MAQKAAKTLASRNSARLNQTHIISLALHLLFLLIRALTFRSSFSRRSVLLYLLLSAPAAAIEYWLEKIGRPRYGSEPGDLKSAGEDLDAKGLTEYLWDVLYWTWGCLAMAGVVGDRAWWLWIVIPLYTIWSAYTTYTGARQGMGGLAGGDSSGVSTGQSKRQQKLEKRGGQRVQYRQ